ncbi:PREDICTED: baculoviral IAP repeat-containing protein 1e-like, partial [Nanorana parkeri]|uniref:baculoviral IAP repeat-containing protein 1e-like n=1 Tax=Nanorana parkeri TaxID=125878 RepID=UPI000854BA5A
KRDTVQCFSCGGCLANWQENDDPWKEHAKWFPECEFLQSMKTPEEIKEYINLYNGFEGFTRILRREFTLLADTTVTLLTPPAAVCLDLRISGARPLCQNQPGCGAANLDIFEDENVRLESFKTWPPNTNIDPASLAKCGFFYAGKKDAVSCYTCGICIHSFQPGEDAMTEHLKHSSDCAFLRRMLEIKCENSSHIDSQHVQLVDQIKFKLDLSWPPWERARISHGSWEESLVILYDGPKFTSSSLRRIHRYERRRCVPRWNAVAPRTSCGSSHPQFRVPVKRRIGSKKPSHIGKLCQNSKLSACETESDAWSSPDQDVDWKELHSIESCLKIHNVHWTDKTRELRQQLIDVYNDSTFSKMSPFPGFSHISVDLRSLFADICILLKDIRNRPLRQLTLPEVLSELRDITIIEGEAGSGRTALLKKIAILWASGKCPILNRFSLVFYISVSSAERQQSLCDIICQQLMGSAALLTEESLGEMIQQLNDKVLLLLDDYGLADSASEAVEELLKNRWNRMTLAVAVSTSASCKVRQYAKNILSIQDFPLFSSLYIFKQLFSHNKIFLESFSLHLMQSTTLKAALKTPLFAFALCVFWVQNSAKNMSVDFSICMTYLMHKILKYGTEKEKLEAAVLSCGQLALEGIFQARFEFTQQYLVEAGVKSDDALRFGLLSRFTSQRLKPIFKFFHPSFQEYLAGRKMNELLQLEDVAKNEKGLSYLQKINTFSSVNGRYYSFLKNACMHSPKTATLIISHIFSLMSNPKAFAHEGGTNLHPPILEMSSIDSILSIINPKHSHHSVVRMLLEFSINIANESTFLAHCAPIILQFLKDKDIIIWAKPDIWLIKFLHKYPEGLMLIKSLEVHVPNTMKNTIPEFWNSEEFKSLWPVPTIDEDYSKAFQLTSDIQQNILDLKYIKRLKVPDLSKLGFDPDHHKISVLRIKAHSCTVENENVLGNLMVFCSLANRIELDLLNCTGFLNIIWPIIDLYKASIMKLSLKTSAFSREEQELITDMTSLEILQINDMPPPEYILSNIHHFKEMKELEVECPPGDWEIIGLLPDEFKSLKKIEKLVFKNMDMETQCDQLAKMIEHFPDLISFTIECKYCPGFEKVITSLCQNTKMETLRVNRPMIDKEIIHLASVLPSLKNLKILEIENQYSLKVESSEIFAQSLASLEKLEELTFPGGIAARKTLPCFIQQLQHMPNLRKLYINRRLLMDSSLLELAKVCAGGYLKNLQVLDLNNNMDITQSGYRDFLNVLDNVPKLQHFGISRPISVQFKTEPITLIALLRCVSKLHHLKELDIFGWLLDEKDMELINEMKLKHPNGNNLIVFWQTTLPFLPIIET